MKPFFIPRYQNIIVAKYIIAKVLIFSLVIFTVIALVIFGNQLVSIVKESLERGIFSTDILPLIGLKMIRDIALILPLSLFLAIILAMNNLYKNSEAVVMNSVGLSDKDFMIFIQPIVISVFMIVLLLTTYALPWSKQQYDMIMQRNDNTSEFEFIKQKQFQKFQYGNVIFYASEVNDNNQNSAQNTQSIEDVFIYAQVDNEPVIVLAPHAQKYSDTNNNVYLRLKDGVRYHGFLSQTNKEILNFNTYDLRIVDGQQQNIIAVNTKIEAKNTFDLLRSEDIKEIAELQWRLAQPLGVLILSSLGVLLGRSSPKSGKNLGILVGVIVFVVYNNLLLIAKTNVEQGAIPAGIGLWGVHLLMILSVVALYFYRYSKLANYLDKIRIYLKKGRHANQT